MKLELWLAPDMGYSLVKAKLWTSPPAGDYYFLLEAWDASYEASNMHPGLWVLKSLDYVDNQMANEWSEVLHASFRDTRLGIDIPEEEFTLEG